MIQPFTKIVLEEADWLFTVTDNRLDEDNPRDTYTVGVEKTVADVYTEDETVYLFSNENAVEADAENICILYASMVEYGLIAERWQPDELAFPKTQLYQFIQPQTLAQLEAMYPDCVITAYNNALAYVQSYIGAMFDVDAMLENGGNSNTALTLRLALCLSTVTFILASSPQYSDVIEQQNKQLHHLLRGLKTGKRSFGKDAIVGDPNVRVSVVSLSRGQRP